MATIIATFQIIIFFLVFYVNIHPSCSRTRMNSFNIKIKLLIRQSRHRLSGKNDHKCLSIVSVVFFVFSSKH